MTTKALTPEEFHKLVEHGNLNDICEAYDALYVHASKLLSALDRLWNLADGFSVSGVYFHEFRENAEALEDAAVLLNEAEDFNA